MGLTIKDIARIAGVSHSTVSRALNNSELVSEETKIKIRAIAEENNFVFNANAQSLIRGKTGCIGLIYPEFFESYVNNLFFNSLQSQVRSMLERENLDVLVSFPHNRVNGLSNIQKLVTTCKVDGMIIVNNQIDEADMDCLRKYKMPFVFLHKHPVESQVVDANYFCTDHYKGGGLAATRLLQLGRKNLICVTTEGEEFDARTEGFLNTLKEADFDINRVTTFIGNITFEYGEREIAPYIAGKYGSSEMIDGVFCQTDLMALGIIQGLMKFNIPIPQAVSIIGYDDIPLASCFHPTLTTIHQPLRAIVNMACEKLILLINSEENTPPVKCLVPPLLMIRES